MVKLSELGSNSSGERLISQVSALCHFPNCEVQIPYATELLRSQSRFVVRAEGREPVTYVQRGSDQYVLTYGAPATSVEIILLPASSGIVNADAEYMERVATLAMKGSMVGNAGAVERVGGPLDTGGFFEAYFKDRNAIFVKVNRVVDGRTEFRWYAVREGKLVAAYQSSSPTLNAADYRAYFDSNGGLVKITDLSEQSGGPSGVRSENEFAQELKMILEEANRARASGKSRIGAKQFGVFVFGSGSNTLQDCASGREWWVTGTPATVTELQQEYVSRRTARAAGLLIEFEGVYHAVAHPTAAGKHVAGDIEVTHWSVPTALTSTSGCRITAPN